MSAPAKHALLSASSAYIWLNCTKMPRACEGVPDEGSPYAAEGSLAHEIGELKLTEAFVGQMTKRTYNNRMTKLAEKSLYSEEMQGYTNAYLEYVKSIAYAYPTKPHVAVERQLDLTKWVPGGFGTGDCIVIGQNTLHIIDLKYGKGVLVSATENPQMKLYALGAIEAYAMLYKITDVVMTVFQPRLDNISTFCMSAEDLLAWGESIGRAAKQAFDGGGEFKPASYCKFCRIAGTCRKRAESGMDAVEACVTETVKGPTLPEPNTISDGEVGAILQRLRQLNVAAWVKKLEAYALKAILDGKSIPGWKAVAGRSDRVFDSYDMVVKALTDAGYDEALLYHKQPETLTGIEALLGRKKFAEILGGHITKPVGNPTLAAESDPREPVRKSTCADDFGPGAPKIDMSTIN